MQINVKDIKRHSIVTDNMVGAGPRYYDILVVDGKFVYVKCSTVEAFMFKMNSTHKPIIISETEKIEVGDWYFRVESPGATLKQATELEVQLINNGKVLDAKKVLVLSEHFSPEQLITINNKFKDGDKVFVECEEILGDSGIISHAFGESEYQIKFNPNVTLHKVEENKDISCSLGVGDGMGQHFVHGDYDSIKILQEKLIRIEKMYSKDDVLDMLAAYSVCPSDYTVDETKREFPHQFKGKREHAAKWLKSR